VNSFYALLVYVIIINIATYSEFVYNLDLKYFFIKLNRNVASITHSNLKLHWDQL